MTDYYALIQQLRDFGEAADEQTSKKHGDFHREIAGAIEELVAERDRLVWAVGEHVAKRKEYFDRAEKAEADLAAAREALGWMDRMMMTEPMSRFAEALGYAPAIAAARAEEGE